MPLGRPSWSYSGFDDFRQRLAREIGIELNEMEHFGGARPWSDVVSDIVPLLNHSDCDGELSPEDCARVAPALRRLIARWAERGDYDREMGERLAGMMEIAGARGLRLIFC